MIPLTGSGGLFTAWGHFIAGLADILALRGGAATSRVLSGANMTTRQNQIFSDYGAQTPNHLYLLSNWNSENSQWQTAQNTFNRAVATEAANLLIQMAQDDVGLPVNSFQAAVTILAQQMAQNGQSIVGSTVSAGAQTAKVGTTPVGTGKIVGSGVNRFGNTLQYMYPSTMTFTCTKDSYTDGLTSGQEQFSVTDQQVISDVYSLFWPGGSGKSKTITSSDPQTSNSAGNVLTNSGFQTFSNPNYPDNWVFTGTGAGAGTTMFSNGVSPFIGTSELKFTGVGGGANENAITQIFNTATSTGIGTGGSPSVPAVDTPYLVGVWTRVDVVPGAGVLTIDLIDQNGNVVNDDNGTPNTFSITLSGETSTFAFHSAVFRLPASMVNTANISSSQTLRFRVRTSTAISSGKSVFIANLGMTLMTQMYTGGPYVGIQRGAKPFTRGDAWTMAFANDWGGAQPTWNNWFQRMFNMQQYDSVAGIPGGLQIPFSVASPTIGTNLIV